MSSHRLILFLLTSCLVACTPRSVREAQDVVAQADSLWAAGQMYGREAGDSTTLAQAYAVLNTPLSTLTPHLSSSYAHACYHYGRLLRERENHVAAMECFINATHSHTRDYHILGRVYSNMGDLCHLASEFPLAYDMFEQSANMFLRGGDSLLYYYGLNNMAFELALIPEKGSCLALVSLIESSCPSNDLIPYCYITKAEVFKRCHEYDSTIYYSSKAFSHKKNNASVALLLAQAYSYKGIKDSSVHYAEYVLTQSPTLEEHNNALYVLTNDDLAKNKDAIRQTAAERSDIQKLLEIRQGKLSQAIQLLVQDINRKPNLGWLYAIVITLLLVGVILIIFISHKRRKHQLLAQHINELQNLSKETIEQMRKRIDDYCTILGDSATLKKDLNWNDYSAMCQIVDHQFYFLARKLQQTQLLSEREIRLCVLSLLDLSYDKMAEILNYAPNGIGKFKVRVAKKLGTSAKNLREFLVNKAINE